MTQTEIIALITYRCTANGFLQVTPPLTYHDQDLFVFSLAAWENEYYFFGFEVVDSATFLANPTSRPIAYKDPAFFDKMTQQLDLSSLHHANSNYKVGLYKIVPDEPACRLTVQHLWETNAVEAARILMVSPAGTWHTGDSILGAPMLLS